MKFILDMNLSPAWVDVLEKAGHEACHWSTIGNPKATDHEIMAWALANRFVVFTHDLDFGAILAATKANAPSVVQVRTQNPVPHELDHLVLHVLDKYQSELSEGALVTVHVDRARVTLLPLRGRDNP